MATPQQIEAAEHTLHAQFCRTKGCTHPIHEAMRPQPVPPMSHQERAKVNAIIDAHDRLLILQHT